jgi:hypothetical protein
MSDAHRDIHGERQKIGTAVDTMAKLLDEREAVGTPDFLVKALAVK